MTFKVDGANGLTFPDSSTQAAAGRVLQVVQATTSTQVAINTNTYTDSTLTASITPKFSTSKILVTISQPYRLAAATSTTGTWGGIQLLRNSTVILNPTSDTTGPYQIGGGSNVAGNNFGQRNVWSCNYLDSPATTSSVTYKTQGRRYDSATTLVLQENDTVYNNTSTITLMEIAA